LPTTWDIANYSSALSKISPMIDSPKTVAAQEIPMACHDPAEPDAPNSPAALIAELRPNNKDVAGTRLRRDRLIDPGLLMLVGRRMGDLLG
jgi:hypothetical protein